MIKGIRGYFVVLFLAASVWTASSLNDNHRQKRQMRNAFYLRQLRNGRYLLPIPIRIRPPYIKGALPSFKHASNSNKGTLHSPWIPMEDNSSEEDKTKKNVYVPPIPPPEIITRQPEKNTFDVPLTKSIQVSQTRPGIQTTGYIKKNAIKVYATITTTERPQIKALGTLAESTVQTLLDFAPVDDGWKPKSFPTPQPVAAETSKQNYGRNLGSKVEKNLNYTGLRFGKVNTVTKSVSQNDDAYKVKKNETNFILRFTPKDAKFTSVEAQAEKVDAPFYVDGPEVKLTELNEHTSFPNGAKPSRAQKTAADLRKEGNIPYQGNKTPMEKVPSAGSFKSNYKDRKTVFDTYTNMQNPSMQFNQKNTVPFNGKGSFVRDPYNAEQFNSAFRTKEVYPNQKEKTAANQHYKQRIKNLETNAQNSQNGHRTFPLESFTDHGIEVDGQTKSNFPYQGHATVLNKNPFSENSDFRDKDMNQNQNSYQGHYTYRLSSKPSSNNRVIKNGEKRNISKVTYDDASKSSPESSNYETNTPFVFSKEMPASVFPNSNVNKYNSVPYSFKNNSTVAKEAITVAEIPLTIGVQYEKPIFSNIQKVPQVKSSVKDRDISINQEYNVRQSSPKSESSISISHEDGGSSRENQNNRFVPDDDRLKNTAFDRSPKQEVINNAPKYQNNRLLSEHGVLKNPAFDRSPKQDVINNALKNQNTRLLPEHGVLQNPAFDRSPKNEVINNAPKNQNIRLLSEHGVLQNSAFDRSPKHEVINNAPKNQNTRLLPEHGVLQNPAFDRSPKHEVINNAPKNQNIRLLSEHGVLQNPAFDRTPNLGEVSNSPNNQNNRLAPYPDEHKNQNFNRNPKLKEVELKNPPEYLDFGDEDFLKPIVPLQFGKENEFPKKLSTFTFSATDKMEDPNKQNTKVRLEQENRKLPSFPNIPPSTFFAPPKTASKVEYYENSKFDDKKPSEEIEDSVYFQQVFPEVSLSNHQDTSRQRFQNYNSGQIPSQTFGTSEEDSSTTNSAIGKSRKESLNPSSYDSSNEKNKVIKEVRITKNMNYSPEDTRWNNIRGPKQDLPQIITTPPVLTIKYDPVESDDILNKRGSIKKVNRTENYVTQRKPSLLPENSNRPRKPKITISSGMLAGILIAALVFLGFLTGSMVYAFHQWKFGRSRKKEKKKKTRNTGFPPEYLDENFAGNTYIHNNIFLPTPHNQEDRNGTDQDDNSMTGEMTYEQPSSSSRMGRYRTYRDTDYD